MILSQYHIFELDTINIYSVAANNGNNIRLQVPYTELEGKNLYIC
jgi:hypothetical protein